MSELEFLQKLIDEETLMADTINMDYPYIALDGYKNIYALHQHNIAILEKIKSRLQDDALAKTDLVEKNKSDIRDEKQVANLLLSNERGRKGTICSDLLESEDGGMFFLVRFEDGEQQKVLIKIEEV